MKHFFPILLCLITLTLGIFIGRQSHVIPTATVAVSPSSTSNQPTVQDFIKQMAAELAAGRPSTSTRPTNTPGEICAGGETSNFDCYETHYTKMVREQGVQSAFADLKARYEGKAYVVAQCHPLTHVIGRIASLKHADVAEAYKEGDSFCWSGYYHGVLEGVVGKIGRDQLASQLNSICASLPGKATQNFDYFNCVHGLGHGLMAFTQTELFEALKLCDNLDGEWERSSCYSGVFMENVIVDNKSHFTKYLKPSQPLYPCNAVEVKYKTPCYLMQTSYMLKITNSDFVKVFGYCAKAEKDFRATCYQSLGRDASGRSSSNVATTKRTCELGQDFEQQSNCLVGAVKDFISYFHGDTQARELCQAVAPSLHSVCEATRASYVKVL